jgi:hypothetical protein
VETKSERCYDENSSLQLVKLFVREEKVSLTKRDQDGQQQAELKKKLQKFVKLCVKIMG